MIKTVTVMLKSNYENYYKKTDHICNCSHSQSRLEMKYTIIKISKFRCSLNALRPNILQLYKKTVYCRAWEESNPNIPRVQIFPPSSGNIGSACRTLVPKPSDNSSLMRAFNTLRKTATRWSCSSRKFISSGKCFLLANDAVIRTQYNREFTGDIHCHPVYVSPTQSIVTCNSTFLRSFLSCRAHFPAIREIY